MALHEEASRYKKVFFVTQERMRERERERVTLHLVFIYIYLLIFLLYKNHFLKILISINS